MIRAKSDLSSRGNNRLYCKLQDDVRFRGEVIEDRSLVMLK
jgi:hypothetical protein